MFESISFFEILLIAVVALVVLGPDKLPGAIRTLGLWIGRLKRSFNTIKADIEREVGADEIRRQLRNEEIMEKIKNTRQQFSESVDSVKKEVESVKQETEAVKKDTQAMKDELGKEFSSLTGKQADDRLGEIAAGRPSSEVPHSGAQDGAAAGAEKPAVQPVKEPAPSDGERAGGGESDGKSGGSAGQGAGAPASGTEGGAPGQDDDPGRKQQ